MIPAARKVADVILGRDFIRPSRVALDYEVLGTEYGGWAILSNSLDRRSVVYSVGIGEDASFDAAVIERYGCEVFGFDPTPRSLEWIGGRVLDARFHVQPVGLAAFDGELKFFEPESRTHVSYSANPDRIALNRNGVISLPVRRLSTLMHDNGHSALDVLKMDIEGSEYDVIEDVLAQRIPVRQWLIEFHHRILPGGARRTAQALRRLRQAGYRPFFISEHGQEFSFVSEAFARSHP
jgi:FkbM family methyltransferase